MHPQVRALHHHQFLSMPRYLRTGVGNFNAAAVTTVRLAHHGSRAEQVRSLLRLPPSYMVPNICTSPALPASSGAPSKELSQQNRIFVQRWACWAETGMMPTQRFRCQAGKLGSVTVT